MGNTTKFETISNGEEFFSDSILNAVSSRRVFRDDRIWCRYSYPIMRNEESLQKEVEFLEVLVSAGLQITHIGFTELHDWDDWDVDMRSYRSIDELKEDTDAMSFIGGTWKAEGQINDARIYINILDVGTDRIYISCKTKDNAVLIDLLCTFEKLYHI